MLRSTSTSRVQPALGRHSSSATSAYACPVVAETHHCVQDGAPFPTASSGVETPGGGSGDEAGGGGEGGGGAFDTGALGKRLGRRRPGLGRGGAKTLNPKPAEPAPKGSCSKDEHKKPKKKASGDETPPPVWTVISRRRQGQPVQG